MNTQSHVDIVDEAIATIGPWQAFLAARRVEIEAQIAQMQGNTPPPVVPPHAPFPASVPEVLPAEGGAREGMGETEAAEVPPDTHMAPPVEGVGEEPNVLEDTAPPPTTLEAAQAHFEGVLAGMNLARFPRQVREAYGHRTQNPQGFAQVLMGAKEQGYVPEALAVAIEGMTRFDPHFMDADRLYRTGKFSALFEIAMDEDESEDEGGDGEAGRAAARGESAF